MSIPKIGDDIRTKGSNITGKVEKIDNNDVYFRLDDNRLLKTPITNVITVQQLDDTQLNEISNELLTKYKTAAGKDASKADKSGDIERGNKRFRGIINATLKQFKNNSKNKDMEEGSMGGINRSAPAQDVSYEKILQDSTIFEQVLSKWLKEQQLNELSVDKLSAYKNAACDSKNVRTRPLGKVAKTVQGYHQATDKINAKTGNRTGSNDKFGPIGKNRPFKDDLQLSESEFRHDDIPVLQQLINNEISFVELPQSLRMKMYKIFDDLPYDIHNKTNPKLISLLKSMLPTDSGQLSSPGVYDKEERRAVEEDITPWGGYTADDKKANALAKAPKSSMTGTEEIPFSELVQDSIKEHGIKWAFNFYVVKHGLPPQHFKIYAGL